MRRLVDERSWFGQLLRALFPEIRDPVPCEHAQHLAIKANGVDVARWCPRCGAFGTLHSWAPASCTHHNARTASIRPLCDLIGLPPLSIMEVEAPVAWCDACGSIAYVDHNGERFWVRAALRSV